MTREFEKKIQITKIILGVIGLALAVVVYEKLDQIVILLKIISDRGLI